MTTARSMQNCRAMYKVLIIWSSLIPHLFQKYDRSNKVKVKGYKGLYFHVKVSMLMFFSA